MDNQYIINLLSLHAILNYSFFFITFRFGKISFRLISFRFISFRLISIRFVSIGFVSFRSISHFTGTLVFLATEQKPCIFHYKPRHRQFRRQITLTMYFNRSFPPFSLDWMKGQRNRRMYYIWTQSFEKVIRCIN